MTSVFRKGRTYQTCSECGAAIFAALLPRHRQTSACRKTSAEKTTVIKQQQQQKQQVVLTEDQMCFFCGMVYDKKERYHSNPLDHQSNASGCAKLAKAQQTAKNHIEKLTQSGMTLWPANWIPGGDGKSYQSSQVERVQAALSALRGEIVTGRRTKKEPRIKIIRCFRLVVVNRVIGYDTNLKVPIEACYAFVPKDTVDLLRPLSPEQWMRHLDHDGRAGVVAARLIVDYLLAQEQGKKSPTLADTLSNLRIAQYL